MAMHTLDSVQAAYNRLADAVRAAELVACGPHIGRANGKTSAINEGTTPLVTCSEIARRTCGRECYAVWHIDNLYPACRSNHAANTIVRRRDPVAYYRAFFDAAQADGVGLIRVNETGDFETVAQLRALYTVARDYAAIQVIGYTRRPELIDTLAAAPVNVHIRYSLYRDGDESGTTIRRAPGCACVSTTETTCPAQIAAAKGRRWSCADCAKHRTGCAGRAAIVIFRSH